jgi:uncharacterized protein (DUF3820 family)
MDEKMTFGRYRGMPASVVPVEYLAWAMAAMRTPPACVLGELHRRASGAETHDALEAQAAINGTAFRRKRKRPRKGWRGVLDTMS